MNQMIARVGALLWLMLPLGCSDEAGDSADDEVLQTAALPGVHPQIDCLEQPAAPALCDWATSVDALHWGTIVKLEMVDGPAIYADGAGEEVDDCPTEIANHALEITLSAAETLVGDVVSTISVRVGVAQLEHWGSRPVQHPDLGLTWPGDSELRVGDTLGTALHRSPDGSMWGLLGEALLTEGADGQVIVQERGDCLEPSPIGLSGMSRTDLAAAVAACGSASAASDDRRALHLLQWDNPTFAYAATCFR